jgi:hypothetical protein
VVDRPVIEVIDVDLGSFTTLRRVGAARGGALAVRTAKAAASTRPPMMQAVARTSRNADSPVQTYSR